MACVHVQMLKENVWPLRLMQYIYGSSVALIDAKSILKLDNLGINLGFFKVSFLLEEVRNLYANLGCYYLLFVMAYKYIIVYQKNLTIIIGDGD
jgi:hypothetical protein